MQFEDIMYVAFGMQAIVLGILIYRVELNTERLLAHIESLDADFAIAQRSYETLPHKIADAVWSTAPKDSALRPVATNSKKFKPRANTEADIVRRESER